MIRRGFTLVEVLVMLAIVTVLAAIITPQVANRARTSTASALSGNLRAVATAIEGFRRDVRRYPSTTAYLATTPPGGATDLCAATIPAGFLARWRGPYLRRPIPATGLVSGDALLLPGLTRSGGTPNGELTLKAAFVEQDIAQAIDASFDGDGNLNAGAIRWSAAGDDTLRYVLPIRGC